MGCATRGHSTNLARRCERHRVVAWQEVSLGEGTGIVHIATGCGAEDFELGKSRAALLAPVDEAGRFYDDYGWLAGKRTSEVRDAIVGNLKERSPLIFDR